MTQDAPAGSQSPVPARNHHGSLLNSVDQFSEMETAMGAEAIWVLAERRSGEQIAELYSHETVLIESLRMFTAHGLLRREGVLLLLTPSHRQALLQELKAEGLDVDDLQRAGQLLLPDAEELLASFMLGPMPDATLFSVSLGEVLAKVRPSDGSRKVRVFSEIVDLLWKSNQPAAISLEQLWSDLLDGSGLSLFCAHSTSHIYDTFPETLRAPHSHILLSAIAETSGDAIVGHTLDPRIVYWNQGAARIFGYALDDVIGQPSSMLMPHGHNEFSAVIERIRRGEHVPHYETRRKRKDGMVIDVSVAVSPVKTRGGELVGVSVIAREITGRKDAEAAQAQVARLAQSQAANQLLLERVFAAEEPERRRIARELHDEAGQLMASVLVGLRALDDSHSMDESKAQAQRLREIVVKAMDELGRLARGLHSSVLADHGLRVALERYAADYSTTRHIAVTLALDELDIDLPPAVQLAVFRIIQEALTNVARHAAASTISIRVARSAAGLETTVADNGRGFDAEAASLHSEVHLGLQSMRERAAILGGTVSVTSGAAGTTISVHIPLESCRSEVQ